MGNPPDAPPRTGWASLRELTGAQWFVFIVCCLAWDLDCMDQQLFVLARNPAVASLLPVGTSADEVTRVGTLATSVFMIGWAIGGIGFGILGDRLGRVKTLTLTILLYAVFTGLSAFSRSTFDFMLYRLLTGLGVGGCFAAAVVLLAESVPERPRPFILGMFQASSVLGNCAAAGLSMFLGSLEERKVFEGQYLVPWRIMFLVGILPGLLLGVVQFFLNEPERWKQLRAEQLAGVKESPWQAFFGTLTRLLQHPVWGKRVLFGLLLTGAGVVGLWGIAFFSVELVNRALKDLPKGDITFWKGVTSLVQNLGGFLGIFAFSYVTARLGRRSTFGLFFLLAALSTAGMFLFLRTRADIFWMVPVMGFCQLALFGGYAIYLPELFPTRYRSTGTSFCYNAGRLVAAGGPFVLGVLTSSVYAGYGATDSSLPFRYAGVTMCSVFLVGLLALPFLPETKGQPLPEDA